MKKVYGCPVELCLDVLGGKWKPVILARLKDGPQRYGELRRLIPDLSDKILTERLKGLIEVGLVTRTPDRRYALSERGRSLRPVLQALYDWGEAAAPSMGLTLRP